MTTGLSEFSFGVDDDEISHTTEKYKGEAGNTDRVSFVWWADIDDDGFPILEKDPDAEQAPLPRWIGGPKVYLKGVGSFFVSSPEHAALAKKAGEEPKKYAATILAIWPTDKDGEMDKDNPRWNKVRVQPWIVPADKYRAVKRKHNQFPVGTHDIMLTCTDSQWQKMEIGSCAQSLFHQLVTRAKGDSEGAKTIVRKILDEVERIEPGLGTMIANSWSIDTIKDKLGLGGSPDMSGTVSDSEVDGMLDGIIDV